jgi:hypothetical protein
VREWPRVEDPDGSVDIGPGEESEENVAGQFLSDFGLIWVGSRGGAGWGAFAGKSYAHGVSRCKEGPGNISRRSESRGSTTADHPPGLARVPRPFGPARTRGAPSHWPMRAGSSKWFPTGNSAAIRLSDRLTVIPVTRVSGTDAELRLPGPRFRPSCISTRARRSCWPEINQKPGCVPGRIGETGRVAVDPARARTAPRDGPWFFKVSKTVGHHAVGGSTSTSRRVAPDRPHFRPGTESHPAPPVGRRRWDVAEALLTPFSVVVVQVLAEQVP